MLLLFLQKLDVNLENHCRYPEKVEAGFSTFKIGNTSVIYDISLFKLGQDIACAEGYFVHVFVKKKNMNEKVKIPKKIKEELKKITKL